MVVFNLSAFCWRRIRDLRKLPDERDWLWGKLCLLMGKAMLSKSLIQFSVDGWSCVPFVISVHFTLVAHRVKLFATPGIAARQASVSITNSWSSLKLTSIESVMPSSHLILCRSLLLLTPIPPSIRVFSNESTHRMRWPKYWSFSFSIIPSKEHPGLISFRMD